MMERLQRVIRDREFWALVLIAGPFLVWLLFADTSYSRHLTDALSGIVPGWLAIAAWALALLFAAIVMAPLARRGYIVIVSCLLLLLSCVFFPVSLRFHPVLSVVILVSLYVEVYWLRSRRRRQESEPIARGADR
jgi:uncharacterized membrane protein YhdT